MGAIAGDWLLIIGRILLGGLFVTAGLQHFSEFGHLTQHLASRRVPLPQVALLIGTAFQIFAGLGLMFGFYIFSASIGLAVFTLVASFLMLNFWDLDGEPRRSTRQVWHANLAIIGGLLISAAYAS